MKSVVFAMKKFRLIYILLVSFVCSGQSELESEHRIRKIQFPDEAHTYVQNKVNDARRYRYYKEVDSGATTYKTKFKKDRLHYGLAFNAKGKPLFIEIRIKEVDFPEDSYKSLNTYLQKQFTKYHIRRRFQQYNLVDNNTEKTLENAFQNILLPSLNYKLLVTGKKNKKYKKYEVFFNADGNFIKLQKTLPKNHDRVLY